MGSGDEKFHDTKESH